MRTRYQAALDRVTASERLKEEVLDVTKHEKKALCKRISRSALIAAVIALLLAGTTLAVSIPHIQDWFQQYWEDATGEEHMDRQQQDVMDGLTQSVGAAATAETEAEGSTGEEAPAQEVPAPAADSGRAPDEGAPKPSSQTYAQEAQDPQEPQGSVTVSLDSVTAGEDTLWMLVHVTGSYQPGERYTFERGELLGAPKKVYSDLGITVSEWVTSKQCKVLEDGSLQILLHYQCLDPNADLTEGGTYRLQLEDLMLGQDPVQKGQWEIAFSLDQVAASAAVDLEHVVLPVEGLEGQETVDFEEVHVTATGVKLICQPQFSGYRLWGDVALVLADGSQICAVSGHGGWVGEADESGWYASYNWQLPVAVEQAVALRFDDTVVPLQ